jgi:hypothetical protein
VVRIGEDSVLLETGTGLERLSLPARQAVHLVKARPAQDAEPEQEEEAAAPPGSPDQAGQSTMIMERSREPGQEGAAEKELSTMESMVRALEREISKRRDEDAP